MDVSLEETQARDLCRIVLGITADTLSPTVPAGRALELVDRLIRAGRKDLLRSALRDLAPHLDQWLTAQEVFLSQLSDGMLSDLRWSANDPEIEAALGTLITLLQKREWVW